MEPTVFGTSRGCVIVMLANSERTTRREGCVISLGKCSVEDRVLYMSTPSQILHRCWTKEASKSKQKKKQFQRFYTTSNLRRVSAPRFRTTERKSTVANIDRGIGVRSNSGCVEVRIGNGRTALGVVKERNGCHESMLHSKHRRRSMRSGERWRSSRIRTLTGRRTHIRIAQPRGL